MGLNLIFILVDGVSDIRESAVFLFLEQLLFEFVAEELFLFGERKSNKKYVLRYVVSWSRVV